MTQIKSVQSVPSRKKCRDSRSFLTVAVSFVVDDTVVRGLECRNISYTGMVFTVEETIKKGIEGNVSLVKKCGEHFYSFSSGCIVTGSESRGKTNLVRVEFISMLPHDRLMLECIVDYNTALTFREKIIIRTAKVKDLEIKIAETRNELQQAFSLVHDTYVKEGFIKPHPSGMRLCLQNAAPETATLIGKINGKVICTTTLYINSFLGVPMDSQFEQEIAFLRSRKRHFGEVGSLATHSDYRSMDSTLQLYLQKALMNYSINYLKLDDVVITVSDRHHYFYKYILQFQSIGKMKYYDAVNGRPAIPMRINLTNIEREFQSAYQYFHNERRLDRFFFHYKSDCVKLPERKSPIKVWNKDLINYFFFEKTDILKKTDSETVKRIMRHYE